MRRLDWVGLDWSKKVELYKVYQTKQNRVDEIKKSGEEN